MHVLKLLLREVAAVNEAIENHEDPSEAYANLPDLNRQFQMITWNRPKGQPSYLELAEINWDHFGDDALTAYSAGHEVALSKAYNGNLERAYTMNAFADHFLEDLFAAGHVRTPRRLLHSQNNISADLCAKVQHHLAFSLIYQLFLTTY